MREIALDTETTGLSHALGDKITEIGCVEIVDKKITGVVFHAYVNPEREVSDGAREISGLTYAFLKNHKTFKEIAQDFLDFISGDKLIIHNAPFDVGFLNAEFASVSDFVIKDSQVVDTLVMARQKYPGGRSSLDALCKKFSIDKTSREKHGALIDARLLAKVYVCMSVEFLQKNIFSVDIEKSVEEVFSITKTSRMQARKHAASDDEMALHNELLLKIKNPIWNNL